MTLTAKRKLIFATIAICLSFPILFFAIAFATSDDQEGLVFAGGYLLFSLGWPLVRLPEWIGYRPQFGPDSTWPLFLAILFVCQWLIWSQGLAWLFRPKDLKAVIHGHDLSK